MTTAVSIVVVGADVAVGPWFEELRNGSARPIDSALAVLSRDAVVTTVAEPGGRLGGLTAGAEKPLRSAGFSLLGYP